jgi:predicted ATPase
VKLHPRCTFLVGENGSGKSTLVEALAVAVGFNPEGGSKNFNFKTAQAHSDLHEYLRVARSPRRELDGFFLRAESFFNVATNLEDMQKEDVGTLWSYGGKSLHEMSHGESFIALMTNRFRRGGLFILDEPEAALSPIRQFSMLKVMHELIQDRGSQFVIATHSPILMAYPDALILSLDEGAPTKAQWEDLEHVKLTKSFINRPDRFLRELFGELPDGN